MAIPLPPLPEQRRIAAILDAADALRVKRRAAIRKLDELTQSIFLDMFGDPASNPKGWPVLAIGGVAQVQGVPAIDLQQRFVNAIGQIRSAMEKFCQSERKMSELFRSFQQRAFRGDL